MPRRAGRAGRAGPRAPTPRPWSGALALLEHHRLAPWAWSRARRSGALENLPPPFIAALGEAHRGATLAHFALLGELRRIEAAFAGNRVAAVALKGASLFTTLYEEPGLRPMEDLDFLVRPEHLRAAGESLAALGYTPVHTIGIDEARRTHFHLAYRSRTGAFRVEVHWGLDDETFLAPAVVPDIWDRIASRGDPRRRGWTPSRNFSTCASTPQSTAFSTARAPGRPAWSPWSSTR